MKRKRKEQKENTSVNRTSNSLRRKTQTDIDFSIKNDETTRIDVMQRIKHLATPGHTICIYPFSVIKQKATGPEENHVLSAKFDEKTRWRSTKPPPYIAVVKDNDDKVFALTMRKKTDATLASEQKTGIPYWIRFIGYHSLGTGETFTVDLAKTLAFHTGFIKRLIDNSIRQLLPLDLLKLILSYLRQSCIDCERDSWH